MDSANSSPPSTSAFPTIPRFEGLAFVDIDAEKNPEARKMAGVDNLPFFATFVDGAFTGGLATAKEDKVVELIEKIL